jgi:hypothetical protein
MAPKRWARVRATRAHGLRRGAWYAVVNDSKPGIVFLDVSKRNVAVDRSLLEFREAPPDRWSVVVRTAEDVATARISTAHLNPTYGVCPQCRARANLFAGAPRAKCPGCGGEFLVDWVNTC